MLSTLIATTAIALTSLTGAALFGSRGLNQRLSRFILPIAVGTFLSVVFFELIPEALHEAELFGSIALAGGFLFFYLLSHILKTYHHHHGEHCKGEETHRGGALILAGDAIHNFADGIVIASAFLINPTVGVVTTLGIALHEVPQEIAEYAVLLRAGYSRARAALLNLLSASTIILGAALTLFFSVYFENIIGILIGIAAGNLLYIAASDILPEIHEEHAGQSTFWNTFLATLFAMIAMTSLLVWSHEQMGHNEEPVHEKVSSEISSE